MNHTKFTSEQAIEIIKAIGGKPIAVEAQWDGDTNGWFIMMFVIIQKGLFKKWQTVHHLGNISLGGDFRIFNGTVPPYPEAQLAIEIGESLKRKYKLEFFFPSPDKPDDGCPRWSEKDLAIECADCKKLIIPTKSPYLPKDICYHCHLERKRKLDLKLDKPRANGVRYYHKTDDSILSLGYATDYKIITAYEFFAEYFKDVDKEPLPVVEVKYSEVQKIHSQIEHQIEQKIKASLPIDESGEIAKMAPRRTIRYKQTDLELFEMGDSDHDDLLGLIPFYERMSEAVIHKMHYLFQFTNGLSYRDQAFLRFIQFKEKGNCSLETLIDRYSELEIQEIEKTIDKLIKLNCLIKTDRQLTITEKGQRLTK